MYRDFKFSISSSTGSIFHETFKRIKIVPDVLYPSINTKLFDEAVRNKQAMKQIESHSYKFTFLSVNRFERKKNLALAIRTLSKFEIADANHAEVIARKYVYFCARLTIDRYLL